MEHTRTEHAAALQPWRDALRRAFSADQDGPSRRGFLKIGGATVLGAAVLAACGDDQGDVVESGTAANLTTTTADPAAAELDVQLLRTATSLEMLAVEAYQTALDSGLLTTADVVDAATLFRDQHDDHRAALEQTTIDATGDEGLVYTEVNRFLKENVVDPAVAELTDEDSVIEFALTLETAAAATYTFMSGELSTTTLRQAVMGIGGVEARHMAVWRGFLDQDQVPVAFLAIDDRIPDEALIDNDEGPAEDGGEGGESTTTTTTAAGDSTTTTSGAGATTTTAAAN